VCVPVQGDRRRGGEAIRYASENARDAFFQLVDPSRESQRYSDRAFMLRAAKNRLVVAAQGRASTNGHGSQNSRSVSGG